jgi:signal transduction histidine kinase
MQIDPALQQSTILVVDDNPTNIQVLFDVLSRIGYRVAIAKSGENALQRLQSYLPDLILLDVMMPGIDGFETCRQLKENPQTEEIPVIFMTALSDPVDKVKGLNLGAVDYITKPIQHEEILARIRVHLQLQNLRKTLEQKVVERTAELTKTLNDLKSTQVQLVQNEKMSSLGQLVAGIAHEINNPVNFIHGNLHHLKDYTQNLLDFVQLYQKHYPNPVPEIQAKAEEIEPEFLQEDLTKIVDSMQIGTDRIRDIVVSLRNFSRTDESGFQAVDIHEGIESTLLILQHRLKPSPDYPAIQIIKNYGKLPVVECYPSQLNQVFMNIFSNAIDALEESSQKYSYIDERQPILEIETSTSNGWVTIRIADNGRGFDQAIAAQLFEPFFTTKPIGKGTGLGLSISRQIVVEKHYGKIECHSTIGKGTEFIIEIPLQQPHS